MKKDCFLSCDWGTSSFRMKWMQGTPPAVAGTVEFSQGIKRTFQEWQDSGKSNRISYFRAVLKKAIDQLSESCRRDLSGYPVICSGMASSSIGMKELPYVSLPLPLDGSSLITEKIPATDLFPHEILLISGAHKPGDVMRGEEVQAIGWHRTGEARFSRCTLILPGTHSKHLYIEEGKIVDFKTFMTGELYQLLRTHSVLKNSIETENTWNAEAKSAFAEGVDAIRRGNLSNLLFSIRARDLEGSLNKTEASYFLSGLLIGSEFRQMPRQPIVLGGSARFNPLYALALEHLEFKEQVTIVEPEKVDQWVPVGQLAAWNAR